MQKKREQKKPKGCLFASDKYPPCILDSKKFPVKVEKKAWNCVTGNATNLLASLGQYDSVVEEALTWAQSDSQTSGRCSFELLKDALRRANYQVLPLPDRLNFKHLSASIAQLNLPLLVSLKINYGEVTYNHVIGICPYKVGDGSVTHY